MCCLTAVAAAHVNSSNGQFFKSTDPTADEIQSSESQNIPSDTSSITRTVKIQTDETILVSSRVQFTTLATTVGNNTEATKQNWTTGLAREKDVSIQNQDGSMTTTTTQSNNDEEENISPQNHGSGDLTMTHDLDDEEEISMSLRPDHGHPVYQSARRRPPPNIAGYYQAVQRGVQSQLELCGTFCNGSESDYLIDRNRDKYTVRPSCARCYCDSACDLYGDCCPLLGDDKLPDLGAKPLLCLTVNVGCSAKLVQVGAFLLQSGGTD